MAFQLSLLLPMISLLLWNSSPYLWKLAGHVDIPETSLLRWENSTSVNNANCKVFDEVNACEDVKIHFASETAFLSCGDPEGRTQWYPCAGTREASGRAESTFREQLVKYDLKTGKLTQLRLEGFEGDFITHGIDIFPLPDDPTKIHIFAVDHARDGDSIVIFAHELGSDVVSLVKNVKHADIKTANGVLATGPLDFYITNDHYFALGPLRVLEEKFGAWSWATNVQYCNAESETVSCRQVAGTFPGANGINRWGDRLFVGDARNATVRIFQIHDDKTLTQLQVVPLGAAADNINIDPTTGDPIVAVFPAGEHLPEYMANVKGLGKTLLVPSAALRLDHTKDYAPELFYKDDGSVISFMTAAAVDPGKGLFLGAGVLQYGGFAVCQVGTEAFA